MRLSKLNEFSSSEISKEHINAFGGYDAREIIKDNYFSDMKNMSGDLYPVLSTRKGRKFIKKINSDDVTLFEAGEHYYIAQNPKVIVDDTGAHRLEDYCLFNSSGEILLKGLSAGKKKIAKMGSYVAIFPDKVVYNTADKTSQKMEAFFKDPLSIFSDRINARSGNASFGVSNQLDINTYSINIYSGNIPENAIFETTTVTMACLEKHPIVSATEPDLNSKILEDGCFWIDTINDTLNLSVISSTGEYEWLTVSGVNPYWYYNTTAKKIYKINKDGSCTSAYSSSRVKLEMCSADGTVFSSDSFTTSKTEPENPKEGDYWLDVSNNKSVLKVYDGTIWTTYTSTYVKITPEYTFACAGVIPQNRHGNIYTSLRNENGLFISNKVYMFIEGSINAWIEIPDLTAWDARDLMLYAMKDFKAYDVINIPCLNSYGLDAGSYMIEAIDNSASSGISSCYETKTQTNKQYIVVLGLLNYRSTYTVNGSSGPSLSFSREVPDMDFVIDGTSRIWGCNSSKHEIYACQDSNILNWNFFQGTAADSIVISDASYGDYTGAVLYNNTPIFFKENRILKILGSYTGAYSLSFLDLEGVQKGSDKSLAVVNGILYFKSPSSICAYDGSVSKISNALGDKEYSQAIATSIKGKYYISMVDKDNNRNLFVFSPSTSFFHKEDNFNVSQFCGQYALADGCIYDVLGGTQDDDSSFTPKSFDWFFETGKIGLVLADNRYISKLSIRAEISEGAYAKIFIEYNTSGIWEHKGVINAQKAKNITLPILPKRCDHLKIRIEGQGQFKLYSLTKTIEKGSEINA